jgi:hypothetical protein
MTRADLAGWLAAYERAWRTPGTEVLREVFAAAVTYRSAPYEEPVRGLEALGPFWEREREGADEPFTMTSEIVAVEGDVGVVRVEVHYGNPQAAQYRDLWIVTLDGDGLCIAFEEWPFFPGQPLTAR